MTYTTCDFVVVAPGDVAVISGPGPIRLLTLQVVKQTGAVVVMAGTGKDGDRLRMAAVRGADQTVNVEDNDIGAIIGGLSDGLGADIVFECAGVEASAAMCLRLVRKGGQYIQVGLVGKPVAFDLNQGVLSEVSVRGSFASVPGSWMRALRLMELDKIKTKPLISHVLPLNDWRKGFELW